MVENAPVPSGNSGMYVFSIKTEASSHRSLRAKFISVSNCVAIRLMVGSLKKSPLRTSLIQKKKQQEREKKTGEKSY